MTEGRAFGTNWDVKAIVDVANTNADLEFAVVFENCLPIVWCHFADNIGVSSCCIREKNIETTVFVVLKPRIGCQDRRLD